MGSPEQKVAKKRGRKPVPKPVVELKIWEKKTSNQIKKWYLCVIKDFVRRVTQQILPSKDIINQVINRLQIMASVVKVQVAMQASRSSST